MTYATRPQDPQPGFWSTLAPQMFRRGHNRIGVYLITGTPSDPHLVAVRLT
jgi:hypothetical protein